MKIRENSKVAIIDRSDGKNILGIYTPSIDIEVEANSIIIVDGGLYCIDSINEMKDSTYQFEVYWQDAVLAKDGYLRESIMND